MPTFEFAGSRAIVIDLPQMMQSELARALKKPAIQRTDRPRTDAFD
jgi:hypothetical protein